MKPSLQQHLLRVILLVCAFAALPACGGGSSSSTTTSESEITGVATPSSISVVTATE